MTEICGYKLDNWWAFENVRRYDAKLRYHYFDVSSTKHRQKSLAIGSGDARR